MSLKVGRTRLVAVALSVLALAAVAVKLGSLYSSGVLAAKRAVAAEDATPAATPPGAHPVIVELFTSEGCSSCPPADALLARLQRDQPVPGANIIALEEHVDYWDHLGWKDRFSSSELTDRQKEYQTYFKLDDVYTPQFVINGDKQLDGSDGAVIRGAIQQAAAAKPYRLQLAGVRVKGDDVSFSLESAPADPRYVNLYAALVDPEDTTEVQAGENKGRTLRHAAVVRWLGRFGSSWHMQDLGRHPEQPFSFQAMLPVYATTPHTGQRTDVPIKDGMRLVVFAQVKHIGPVLGAASCSIAPQNIDSAPATSPQPADACPAPLNSPAR